MNQFLIIGSGETKDSLTLKKRNITNHIHSAYDNEISALRIAHWLNRLPLGMQYHVEENEKSTSAKVL